MSRYRRILTRIWEDDKFPHLSLEARLLFVYHLTSPRSTPFLLYVEGPGALADALRLPSARLRQAMGEVRSKGMVLYSDDGSNLLFLPNALRIRENAPESENAVKSWVGMFRDLPRSAFRDRCVCHWGSLREGITHAFTLAFLDAIGSFIGTQETQTQTEVPSGAPEAAGTSGPARRANGKGATRTAWWAEHGPAVREILALHHDLYRQKVGEAPTNGKAQDGLLRELLTKVGDREKIARALRDFFAFPPKRCRERNDYSLRAFRSHYDEIVATRARGDYGP